jgi:uncharacterized protein involved in response to NO
MNLGLGHIVAARKSRPRGIATGGPAILSYGFRPFFLCAGLFAFVSMAAWIGTLTFGWPIGGSYGALNWHAHEMLFGYTGAALAGFLLTAIPNWTGRLPVSGTPLLALVLLWLAGRVAMAVPDLIGPIPAAAIDASFMPALAFIAGQEILAGRNWKNLKILAGLVALSGAGIAFHVAVALNGEALAVSHFTIAIFIVLIAIVGGRIIPSFTRNWLASEGSPVLPKPFGPFDIAAIAVLIPALLAWIFIDGTPAAAFAFIAAGFHLFRLTRWVGWRTMEEPLLIILHVAYGFVPLGLAGVGLAELGLVSDASALHVLTVGGIGCMTFAIMTRASLGHTGRRLTASTSITIAYLALILAAVIRPFAEIAASHYHLLLGAAGACWLIAFALFLMEYTPILTGPRFVAPGLMVRWAATCRAS